jgi:hypoxanthine-guanine phosphoribosyltransferase/ribosomal protein S18 acetylase RimI-like enzyme
MFTYLISEEDVRKYARDLCSRLMRMEPKPDVLCPITQSGTNFLRLFLSEFDSAMKERFSDAQIVQINVTKESRKKHINIDDGDLNIISGRNIFLIDVAIHSGNTMKLCEEALNDHKPAEVFSYSLVVKRSANYFPSIWGLMIEETDRAYFLLDKIPNNRLSTGGTTKPQLPVRIIRLDENSSMLPTVTCGVGSMDKLSWGDRLFQMRVTDSNSTTYLLKRGDRIVGYLTVHTGKNEVLYIDEVAVDTTQHENGYGGVMLRFADTLARHYDCRVVRLNAISNKISWYEKYGYEINPAAKEFNLDGEIYHQMQRPVIYCQNALEAE